MTDTVKTRVMKAIAYVLATIPEVRTVLRREPVATDLDKINLPALFLYEEEETGARHNRLRIGVINVEMVVFIRLLPQSQDPGFEKFYDLAEIIRSRVWVLLQSSPELTGLVLLAQEDLKRPAIGNEAFGELVLKYRITYGHAVGDPFTTQV